MQTVKVCQTRIAGIVRNFFNLSNEHEVSRIQRIRTLSDKPIYFLENFMSLEVAKHITLEELSERPILETVKEKLGMVVDRGEMFIESIPAEIDIADILECQPFDPLSFVQIFYWFPSEIPFEVVNCFVRGDYFKYKVDLDAKGFQDI